jgi:hypothetical protein
VCSTLHQDGFDCQKKLLQSTSTPCLSYCQELLKLHKAYKIRESDHSGIELTPEETNSKEKLQATLAGGRRTLHPRDQVNHRFFAFSASNRLDIKWTLGLHSEIRAPEVFYTTKILGISQVATGIEKLHFQFLIKLSRGLLRATFTRQFCTSIRQLLSNQFFFQLLV